MDPNWMGWSCGLAGRTALPYRPERASTPPSDCPRLEPPLPGISTSEPGTASFPVTRPTRGRLREVSREERLHNAAFVTFEELGSGQREKLGQLRLHPWSREQLHLLQQLGSTKRVSHTDSNGLRRIDLIRQFFFNCVTSFAVKRPTFSVHVCLQVSKI